MPLFFLYSDLKYIFFINLVTFILYIRQLAISFWTQQRKSMKKLKLTDITKRLIYLPTTVLLISGCQTTNEVATRDALRDELDSGRFSAPKGEVANLDKWWVNFDRKELNDLVTKTLSENTTIEQAYQRLKQAQAITRKTIGTNDIQVDGEIGTVQGRRGIDNNSVSADNYSLGLTARYEVDLWGKLDAVENSSRFDELAVAENLFTARMLIATETVEAWLRLAETRETIKLINNQITVNKKILKLVELRFKSSQATGLDVLQQRQILAQTESLLPLARADEQILINKLATLTNTPATDKFKLNVQTLPELRKFPAIGIPATLLDKRPDIRAKYAELMASREQLKAAEADKLPTLTLSATAKYDSDDAGDLFDNWLANLAGGLVTPILDGNTRQSEIERVEAQTKERIASYRETVLTAINEVQDAIIQEQMQHAYLEKLNERFKIDTMSVQQAGDRFKKGLESYLPVLTAMIELQEVERTIIETRAQELIYRVQLHRSLGGDWMQKEKNNDK